MWAQPSAPNPRVPQCIEGCGACREDRLNEHWGPKGALEGPGWLVTGSLPLREPLPTRLSPFLAAQNQESTGGRKTSRRAKTSQTKVGSYFYNQVPPNDVDLPTSPPPHPAHTPVGERTVHELLLPPQ